MKSKALIVIFLFALICMSESRGGGGRGGGRRGSSSRGSASRRSNNRGKQKTSDSSDSSGGWFGGMFGGFFGSKTPKTIGKSKMVNSKSSKNPAGPPPAYPGLENRHLPNSNAPPAYSPSYSHPPAYNSLPNYPKQPAHNPSYHQPNSHYPGGSYSGSNNNYGSSFGANGLGGNNYYGGRSSSGSSFLTSALFFGAGMHMGRGFGGGGYGHRRSWDEEEDRNWRATTKAPYFENKVPGSDSEYLPAAAVIGAATAFGLVSLLPLNVPADKPLMYCNNTDILQNPIQFNFNVFWCVNGSVAISCPRVLQNETVVDVCFNQTLQCDVEKTSRNMYCTEGTMYSQSALVCNSTMFQNGLNNEESPVILNCYSGSVANEYASYIPTLSTTEAPNVIEKEKDDSFFGKIKGFFASLVGDSEEGDDEESNDENEGSWVPEALTIPPEAFTILPEASTISETEEVTTNQSDNLEG